MSYNWDDDDSLMAADADAPVAGPSRAVASKTRAGGATFMNRVRSAPDDDDDDPTNASRKKRRAFVEANAEADMDMEKESGVYGGEDGEETEMQQLIRHWMNERQAPDVLPAQDVLLGTMLDRIRRQSDTIALLRSDPDSSEEEHFRIMLAQTEIERVKFVVRSYVRTRLYKIEKYARYLVANPDLQEKLTQIELEHAKTFAKLTEAHFHQSVLQALPEEQRRLTDHVAFMPPMIPEPDKTRAVFVHARTKCPPVRLPDGSALEMQKGQISLTPYYVIEQLLVRGEVELV